MNNSKEIKVKNHLRFLLFLIIIVGTSNLLVYKVSFFPSGYDLISHQKNSISIKSFNVLGFEKGISTVSFSEKDIWKINDIAYEINRQKEFLWFFFSVVSISIYLLVTKLRKGMKFWKAILESNIVIAVLFPLYIIISSLNRIQNLIS
ncbi:hypothetical protein [Neobacillus sp. PS3-40]|uniref:hypothetical protein n=1 Tax=Neobacillus sp. PS3-40 TaxID=3070679 RepID=UPI0027DF0FDA|nr:hypothetical protein [Neobacillus sp. PS3-40]WML44595.1 hypothetical protein RCG20_01380 [Neobacillus sp. PS3-40]